jgi:Protein of unknown function (DUF1439)
MRERALKIVAAVTSLLAIAVVFNALHGRETVYRISEQELRERLSARLPVTLTYLLIFEARLDHPRVSLAAGSNRVDAGVDVTVNIRVAGSAVPLLGSLDVSTGIRYVPEDGEFFLTDPVITHLAIAGVPDRYARQAQEVVAKAVGEYLAKRPIYRLSRSDMRQLGLRLLLKRVDVQDHEIAITMWL